MTGTRVRPGWLLLGLWVGCGHRAAAPETRPAAAGGGGKGGEVMLDPEAGRDGDLVLAAWLAYGVSKADLYGKQPPPPANQSADDFALELGAREVQCTFWEEQRKTQPKAQSPSHAVFDRQVQIWRAGFLPEMVLMVHARPGWTVPGAVIAAARLEEFVTRFAGDYKPGAPVAIKPASGKLLPDAPGEDFPDPDKLPIGPGSCPLAREERQAAWKRWQGLQPRLGGVPVAAVGTMDFGRHLAAVRNDKGYTGRGVTWVSMRVAHAATLDGYCAVEAKDWANAVAMLERAVALVPAEPMPRLELALALASVKRHEEALAQADRGLGQSRDGCMAALAWRRRGYILMEIGALGPAKAAYEKSLTLEPGSQLARNALATIATLLKQQGNRKAGEQHRFDPPAGELVHTVCTEPAAPAK